MSILSRLGVEAVVRGATPANENEFRERVEFVGGRTVTWTEWQAAEAAIAAEEREEALRAEAARRIQAVLGARDERDAEIKQLNALRKVAEINYRRTDAPDTFTASDAAYLAAANGVSQLIDAIRDRSNAFPPEGAVDDDALWPAMGG